MIPCFAETISKWVEFRKAFNRRLTLSNLNPNHTKSVLHTKCSLYYNLESIRGTLLNKLKREGDSANIPYHYASGILYSLGHKVKRINAIHIIHEPLALNAEGRPLIKRVISFRFHETIDYSDKNRLIINPKCIAEQETFQCRLSYLSVKWTVSNQGPTLNEVPHHCMERLLLQAYKIQDVCNFEFICKDNEVVTGNKLILQVGSTYFRGVWDQMLLPEVDGEIVREAIKFIYTGENPFEKRESYTEKKPFEKREVYTEKKPFGKREGSMEEKPFAKRESPPDPVKLLELSDEWLLRPLFEHSVHEIVKQSTPDQGEDLIWLGTTYNSHYLIEVGKFYLRKSAVI